jgi:hypothetical protein
LSYSSRGAAILHLRRACSSGSMARGNRKPRTGYKVALRTVRRRASRPAPRSTS